MTDLHPIDVAAAALGLAREALALREMVARLEAGNQCLQRQADELRGQLHEAKVESDILRAAVERAHEERAEALRWAAIEEIKGTKRMVEGGD